MSKKGAGFKGKAMIAALVLLLMMSSIPPTCLAVDRSINVSSSTIFIDGDWIVSDTNITENKEIILNGNLTITPTGSLTLNNVTLKINQSANGEYTLNVNNGGEFYVDKSNITSNNSYRYWFEVYGKLRMNNTKLSRTYAQIGKWGGIHVYSGDVYVGNSTFYDYSGAGMTIRTSNITVYNTTFSDGFRGIWAWYWGNITVEKCTFVGSVDAALKIMYDVVLYVGNSTIRDGMDGIGASGDTNIVVFNLTAVNNTLGAGGVGIWLRSTSKANIVKFNGTNNLYGVWVDVDSNATISDSIFRENDEGIEVSSNANATVINCTIEGNGGGVDSNSDSNTTIINCTIKNNNGGVLSYSTSNVTVLNSTVSSNTVDFDVSGSAWIFIKWFLHVGVLNLTDAPIPNANVRVYNKTNGLIFDGYTGFDGWWRWIPVTNKSFYRPGINPVETTYYDPHNITAEYNAVTNYTEETMDVSKEVIIKLDIELEYDPPVIEHTQITSAPLGESINISANVSDYSGVGNVILNYENVGDTEYIPMAMSLVSGDAQDGTWNASIPVQTEVGVVHYFVWVNDFLGNNATSPTTGDYAMQITGPPTVEIISPIGGEDWTGGSNHQIEFTTSDTEDDPADLTVFLNYISSAGNGVITQLQGNQTLYSWTLPSINATDVRVNATVIDKYGNKAYDDSAMFEIDSAIPEVSSTIPANGMTGVSIYQSVIIQFNEPMNISTVTAAQTGGADPGGWSWFWNAVGDNITGIHNPWQRGDTIEITVQAGYTDDSDPGNTNNTAYVFSFTTETNPSPEILHTNISGPIELGDAIRINAIITDDGTVMNAVLWWRDVDGVWHENNMQKKGDDWEYFIPGQMKEGKVRYRINATDDLGQVDTTTIYEFNITDTTSPVIAHTPIENAFVNEAINITCGVNDLGGVNASAVYLFYREVGETSFTQTLMNDGFWYEIPAQSEPVDIEYYIQAFDIYGNDALTDVYSFDVIDITQPVIQHSPVTVAETGQDITIVAIVEDNVAIDVVKINYTDVSGIVFNISMAPTANPNEYSAVMLGPNNIGTINYYIWANDTSGNAYKSIVYSIQIIDTTPPTISHSPVTTANIGDAITITVMVEDIVGVNCVVLYYQTIGTITYSTIEMSTTGNANEHSATIPAQSENGLVHYYIWANDTSGNSVTSPANGAYSISITGDIIPPEIIFTSPSGTNVSVPFDIVIVFSEAMNRTSVENALIIEQIPNDTAPEIVGDGISFNWTDDNILKVELSLQALNATYNITIGMGAKDLAGNQLTGDYSWQFTTEPPLDTVVEPPQPTSDDHWWIGLILLLIMIIVLETLLLLRRENNKEG